MLCEIGGALDVDGNRFAIIRGGAYCKIVGSHWLMAYGDYLNEMGYGVRKLGFEWLNISEGSK